MKRLISLAIVVALVFSCVLTGCSQNGYTDPTAGIKKVASTDKYRNFYQIWIYSFCDSNNDGIGDINGITSKLDYLNDGDPSTDDDLGVDGIWLSPMMVSPSYHKYDVTNYYDIDPEFGTMADFEKLLDECHKRGIKVIIDLVLNHCSSSHPWFKKACEEVAAGNLDGYAKYFDFSKYANDFDVPDGYNTVSGAPNMYYEGQFSPEMPDWNLNYQGTKDEFEKISKFWLDKGVDGYRLDAVKYFTNNNTNGEEFMKWFYDTSAKYNKDVYMVGENWDTPTAIYDIYKSGIDSQFAFKFGSTTGLFMNAVNSNNIDSLVDKMQKYQSSTHESNKNAIDGLFLTNHDMPRSANSLQTLAKMKMAAALYMLMPGNSYTYYGEEIGIMAPNTTNDASYRTPMIWDSKSLPTIECPGVAEVEDTQFGGVKQQLADENSLMNFYKRIIKIKNQNPEIARGIMTPVESFNDNEVGAYYVEYDNSKLLIIHNGNEKDSKELSITDDILKNAVIRGDLVASDPVKNDKGETVTQHITLKEGNLTMPPQSTVILKTSS